VKQRIVTGLLIAGVTFPPLYFGGIILDVLLMAFAVIGINEVIKCFNLKNELLYTFLVFTITLCAYVFSINQLTFFIVIFLLVLFIMSILDVNFTIDHLAILFTSTILVILAVVGIRELRDFNVMLLFLVLIGTYATDSFAYLIGSKFGKHKLIERISPKKTVEGLLGGWIMSFVFIMLIYYIWLTPVITLIQAIVIGIILPLIGQLGDLAFSMIKRKYQLKDFGSIFPGHGGILDRVDSLVFTVIIMLVFLQWIR